MARCPKEGTLVKFRPNPASLMLYSRNYGLPKVGERGRVTSIPVGRGRSTCMPGPGGGLVYVDWEGGITVGVSKYDIVTGREALSGARGRRRKAR